MLWHYPYFDHEVCRLHEQISGFVSAANNEGRNPRNFSLIRHCCPELRARCERSNKLKAKLRAFYNAFVNLKPSVRRKVFEAFQEVNAIDAQLGSSRRRHPLDDLPQSIQASTKTLFIYLYTDTLGAGGKVEAHWREFYRRLKTTDCPFCAIEPLHHPDFYKQDYDHLLCKDTYPFAAINMRNLVPMGRDCNTIFKKAKDILMKNGRRRKAFRPFEPSGMQIQIDLAGSIPPTAINRKGNWKINITPRCQEVSTWVDVFEMPARYEKEILETKAIDWIGEFRDLAAASRPEGGWNITRLRGFLGKYAKSFSSVTYKERHFLKAPFYNLLHKRNSHEFLKPLLNSI